MTPEQLAKMQAGRAAAAAARKLLPTAPKPVTEDDGWEERHARWYQDLLRIRAEIGGWS